jgi:hypothetical protein
VALVLSRLKSVFKHLGAQHTGTSGPVLTLALFLLKAASDIDPRFRSDPVGTSSGYVGVKQCKLVQRCRRSERPGIALP